VAGFDFGERALVTNEPRSATVMTITPTDLLVVDREVFSRYVKNILFCLFKFKSNYFW
jgi:CRP-like cAMP-binding protein